MEYGRLVEVYEQLEKTTKRLEKTKILATFLKDCPKEDVEMVFLLVQGLVFPSSDNRKIGIASKMIVKSIAGATGLSSTDIEKHWKKTGDLGTSIQELITKTKQHTLFHEDLTVNKVFMNVRKLATIEGTGSSDIKVKIISELLTSATPSEARYIARTVLEDLRVGLGEGTLRDAIALSYYWRINHTESTAQQVDEIFFGEDSELKKIRDEVQKAYDITNDYAQVAQILADNDINALQTLQLNPLKPIKVMLAQKVVDVKEGFETVGTPCALEYKYDGFRMIIGKEGDTIIIHTRRLENVTTQFPDVIERIKNNVDAHSCIIDCEAVGYDSKSGKYVPFQQISQRIRRKYDIEKLAEEIPVELNIFDILYYNGESTIQKPFIERRALIEKIVREQKQHIKLSTKIITDNEEQAKAFYHESLNAGNEGIMLKTLNAEYKIGSRVGFMIKLKPVMETLDVVIVAAEWGEGKRAGWLTSYTVAVYDEASNEYVEIGKFGTGIKEKLDENSTSEDASFGQLTELLRPHISSEDGREVRIKPEIVVEIKFEEIQKSPSYSSGYAMRFPRLVRVRDDRGPEDISTLDFVEKLYKGQ